MANRGNKHTYAERRLMAQVAKEFKKRKVELGARKAAKQLDVSLASFYKYVAGTDLPRMEVLKRAQEKWGLKWDLIDPAQILRTRKIQSSEQYLFSFLKSVRQEDVLVYEVTPPKKGPEKENALQITLKIRFTADAS